MKIDNTIAEAGDKLSKACTMLIVGVAFQKDGKTWDVFSCWGDHMGSLSTHMVGCVNRFMKEKGLIGLFNHGDYSYGGIETVTFSRAGWNLAEQSELLEEAPNFGHID